MTSETSGRWSQYMESRVRNFHMAYNKAMISAAAHSVSAGNKHDDDLRDMQKIISMLVARPLSEVEASLDPFSKLTIAFQPREALFEPTLVRPADRLEPDFFVPQDHRALVQVFTEFVAERYVSALLPFIDAYVELYVFGRMVLNPSIRDDALPWTLDQRSSDAWKAHLRAAYIGRAWQKEGWASDHLDEELILRLRTSARNTIGEARVDPVDEPRRLYECGRLLDNGPEGFLATNRSELSSAFRNDFIAGRRQAVAMSDDGTIVPVPWEWWRGDQCTQTLNTRNFVHPKGVLLECLATDKPQHTFEEKVSSAMNFAQDGDMAKSAAAANIEVAVRLMKALVQKGEIPLKSHTKVEVVSIFRKAHPDHPISQRGFDEAVEQLMKAHPELRAPKGRPQKRTER